MAGGPGGYGAGGAGGVPEGRALAIRARDELGAWCQDADFSGVYQVAGRPGISPAQLAMVSVLQFAGNLTDRQAADAVRGRLDWKYCLGLELDDDGFDFSVLSEFRDRLVAGGSERLIFDLLLDQLTGRDLVAGGGRQRTDSTHVLARIRELNRLELAGESVRAALEALAAAAPGWLATVIDASWQEAYGQRIDEIRLPASQAKRDALAVRYGRDGYRLLEAVRGPGAPGWARDLPAVQVLRRVWVQQYYREIGERGEKVQRRERDQHGLPPGRARIVSPYDTDARYSEKRGRGWAGYKAHLTETISDGADDDPVTGCPAVPNLITNVATTAAPVTDHEMTGPVHDSLDDHGLLPGEHAVDSGYASADQLIAARQRGITLLGPLLSGAPPGGHPGGYTAAAFTIDWDHHQVTCPQGQHSASWTPCPGRDTIIVKFPPATCRPCPVRARCTTSPPPAGSSACDPARSTRPSPPPAPSRTPPVESPLRRPRRRRGHHRPGHPHHRHPPRPLHRTGQDHPPARPRRHRPQPHPPRRLVDPPAPRPPPHHPPPATRPPARGVSSD